VATRSTLDRLTRTFPGHCCRSRGIPHTDSSLPLSSGPRVPILFGYEQPPEHHRFESDDSLASSIVCFVHKVWRLRRTNIPYVRGIVHYAPWVQVAHVRHAYDLHPAVRLYAGVALRYTISIFPVGKLPQYKSSQLNPARTVYCSNCCKFGFYLNCRTRIEHGEPPARAGPSKGNNDPPCQCVTLDPRKAPNTAYVKLA
jgi:hypothetical protein